jgi:dimeric dUTPase (all-alpha-NTP-PPase superfamily)
MIEMNVTKLFEMQKGLDQHIEEQHQLTEMDLFDRKVLALLVELGELANETRCFKFWSLKDPSASQVILEEFVDGIHFILSLGLECGYEKKFGFSTYADQESDLTNQFITIYKVVGEFQTSRSLEDFQALFQAYLHLAALLGFSNSDIEKAYIKKNEVNYQRQQQGY